MAWHLIGLWSTPDRHFHNVRHLINTLARVDELAAETQHPDLVRLATWFHGAVFSTSSLKSYSRSAGEDKEASARLAADILQELGIDADVRERVSDMILALRHHQPGKCDIDQQVLCDADLGAVATAPQKYRAYREAVRHEFAHLPSEDYVPARIAVITGLLGRRNIFHSPLARDWEEPARENLTAELARLTKELADLEAAGQIVAKADAPHPQAEASLGGAPEAAGASNGRSSDTQVAGGDPSDDQSSGAQVTRVPLAERRSRALGDFEDSHTSTITRVTPSRLLRVAASNGDTSTMIPQVSDALAPEWDKSIDQLVPDGIDTVTEFHPADAVVAGADEDTRSSLELGPEALFASLDAITSRVEGATCLLPKITPNAAGATIRGLAAVPYMNAASGNAAAENVAAAAAAKRNGDVVYKTFDSALSAEQEEDESPAPLSGIEREPNLDTRLRRNR